MSTDQITEEILTERRGSFVMATLNRPKALNALNQSMIVQLTNYFKTWDSVDNNVSAMVVRGAGGKAFCAGGDVKGVVLSEHEESRIDFFFREYNMNYLISKLEKPLICLMDGYVMGGGCGIAMHAPFRIATEKTVCAMPECVIGFSPDVGSSYFLNRLPDTIGTYMAVTGKRVQGLELKAIGLATHYISSDRLPFLIEALETMGNSVRDHSAVDTKLKEHEVPHHLKDMPPLFERLSKIGKIFNPFESTLAEIRDKLSESQDEDSKEALKLINSGAPLSCSLAFELFKRNAGQSLKTCLETEFTVAANLSRGEGEFFEGVRALLIDKDKNPNWKYQFSQIDDDLVESFFRSKGNIALFGNTSKL